MNEKQRLDSQISVKKTEKSTEDFAKYFQTTYQAPNLKDAKRRGKENVNVHYDFEIPENIKNLGKDKKFLIRTYGCQMNEHDTEIMAGIFEEMGYEATTAVEEADVVLLNTCAIRENAENKVFGELGHLKPLKMENPNLIIGVCGCMSQEESVVNRIMQKHQFVDLIFGTHNIHRLPELMEQAVFGKEMVMEVWSKKATSLKTFREREKVKSKPGLILCTVAISSVHTASFHTQGEKNEVVDRKISFRKYVTLQQKVIKKLRSLDRM